MFTFPLNTPGSDPLVRQLYEFEEQIEDPTRLLTPMSRSLWKYRRQVTIEHLGNSFQQESQATAVNQYKVLDAFLKQVTLEEFLHYSSLPGANVSRDPQFLLRLLLKPASNACEQPVSGILQARTVTQIHLCNSCFQYSTDDR